MRRALTLTAGLLLGLAVFSTPAQAGWSIGVRIGSGGTHIHGGYSHHRHRPRPRHRVVHVHRRVPVYRTVWVPPAYGNVCVGHTRYGRRVYKTVIVRHGYHRQVLVGYRCGSCGVACR